MTPAPPTTSARPRQHGAPAADDVRLWRYIALAPGHDGNQETGELLGTTAADVRAALRRIGLQAIDVQPLKRTRTITVGPILSVVLGEFRTRWQRLLRKRRGSQRAEMYDSISTMVASGLPLLQAIQTLVESREAETGNGHVRVGSDAAQRRPRSRRQGREEAKNRRRSRRGGGGGGRGGAVRGMLVEMRERLRGGDSLAQAMQEHPAWFNAVDIAIVEAGQHGGNLSTVLGGLAERQERSNELSHRLLGALAYPLLVLLVGLGVVVFLSVKTLPDLTKILVDAKIPIPTLTARVMWFGQAIASHWLLLAMMLAFTAATFVAIRRLLAQMAIEAPAWLRPLLARLQPPRLLRRLLVGGLVVQLSDLLRSGVPVVEALRVLAPAQRSARLQRLLTDAAKRIEHGEDLSAALDDRAWFDPELRRLVEIGQASGELDEMLTRIGERYQRRAKRLIDRLTVLLEPAVLLMLATLVGTVVMAAVLPLLALQEIIR